jgi:hypothetical protein
MPNNHTTAPIMFRTVRRRRYLSVHKFREPNICAGILGAQFTQLRRIEGEDDDEEANDEDGAGDADSECDFDACGEFTAGEVVCCG